MGTGRQPGIRRHDGRLVSEGPNEVLVIGAGIVGVSIAYHLARAGTEVILVDSQAPGDGATSASFAWINASEGNPKPYFDLRREGMAGWRRLQADMPDLRVDWNGTLFWEVPPDELRAFEAGHSSWGYAVELVDRHAISALTPDLAEPPALAAFCGDDGAVDPLEAIDEMLKRMVNMAPDRIDLNFGINANRVILEDGRCIGVETDEEPIEAGHVVIAAGSGSPALLKDTGVPLPMADSPGLIVRTKPVDIAISQVLWGPEIHLRQMPDQSLMIGRNRGGADIVQSTREVADHLTAEASRLLGAPLKIEDCQVGIRPIPDDRFPVIGAVPGVEGLSVAVMHSGVTLAPAVGQLLGDEILAGEASPLLGPFRPGRFAS